MTKALMRLGVASLITAIGCSGGASRDSFVVGLPNLRSESGLPRITAKDNPSDARGPDQIARDTALLAAEAERRGLAASYDVQRALRIAVAQTVINSEFRDTADPANLTVLELEQAFKKNIWSFNRPPFVSLAHLLFAIDKKKDRAEQMGLAARLCMEAVAQAKRVKSADAFRALKKRFDGRGLDVKLEEFRTWPGKLEKTFEDVAFNMRTPGDVSDCVASNYGMHIIYLHQYEPAVEKTPESVKEDVRKLAAPEFAAYKFSQWIKKMRPVYRASVVPNLIAVLRKEPTK